MPDRITFLNKERSALLRLVGAHSRASLHIPVSNPHQNILANILPNSQDGQDAHLTIRSQDGQDAHSTIRIFSGGDAFCLLAKGDHHTSSTSALVLCHTPQNLANCYSS